ncbi:MAG: hypothetical protein LBD97_00750 [Bifidobacteriaceae bacterium]|nr:hypothetical protein [Bifidobacteriaceae bacterium]
MCQRLPIVRRYYQGVDDEAAVFGESRRLLVSTLCRRKMTPTVCLVIAYASKAQAMSGARPGSTSTVRHSRPFSSRLRILK